jgi:hypothetical protein
MGFGEQMFTKASQNSDISASCSENIVTVAFYVNVKSCRYFINRLALRTSTAGRPLVCIISYLLYSKYSIVIEDHCQHQISMKFLFEPSLFVTVTNYY